MYVQCICKLYLKIFFYYTSAMYLCIKIIYEIEQIILLFIEL